MNKSLLLEVKGRSLELISYTREKATLRKINRALIAFHLKAEREGITPKQRELQAKAIKDKILDDSRESLDKSVAKDVRSQIELIDKHIGDE